jgi:hypothetical protein
MKGKRDPIMSSRRKNNKKSKAKTSEPPLQPFNFPANILSAQPLIRQFTANKSKLEKVVESQLRTEESLFLEQQIKEIERAADFNELNTKLLLILNSYDTPETQLEQILKSDWKYQNLQLYLINIFAKHEQINSNNNNSEDNDKNIEVRGKSLSLLIELQSFLLKNCSAAEGETSAQQHASLLIQCYIYYYMQKYLPGNIAMKFNNQAEHSLEELQNLKIDEEAEESNGEEIKSEIKADNNKTDSNDSKAITAHTESKTADEHTKTPDNSSNFIHPSAPNVAADFIYRLQSLCIAFIQQLNKTITIQSYIPAVYFIDLINNYIMEAISSAADNTEFPAICSKVADFLFIHAAGGACVLRLLSSLIESDDSLLVYHLSVLQDLDTLQNNLSALFGYISAPSNCENEWQKALLFAENNNISHEYRVDKLWNLAYLYSCVEFNIQLLIHVGLSSGDQQQQTQLIQFLAMQPEKFALILQQIEIDIQLPSDPSV